MYPLRHKWRSRAERQRTVDVEHTGDGYDGDRYDVVVVGGGNAGYCAAHAAAERGRRVVLLEKGPRGEAGGNSFYTAGATRHRPRRPRRPARPRSSPTTGTPTTEVPPYPPQEYAADLTRSPTAATTPS